LAGVSIVRIALGDLLRNDEGLMTWPEIPQSQADQ
jgi:hypothetical protein